jgi:hypothetical protein
MRKYHVDISDENIRKKTFKKQREIFIIDLAVFYDS